MGNAILGPAKVMVGRVPVKRWRICRVLVCGLFFFFGVRESGQESDEFRRSGLRSNTFRDLGSDKFRGLNWGLINSTFQSRV